MIAGEAPENESLRLELQEAITEFRHGASILTQAGGIIATGDVLLLSYGFSQKVAAILLVASISPMGILLIYLIVSSIAGPLVGLILRLERKLLIQEDSLGATYLRSHMRSVAATLGDIENLDDEQIRALDLSTLKGQLGKAIPISLCAATIAQVGLFVLSLAVYHYRFI
ncbi:MAG TPA: hypothetical protein VF940_16755 [Streptosporangiaceae bacterium]